MKDLSIPSDHPTRRILVIPLGQETGTSARLFRELSNLLAEDHACRNLSISVAGNTIAARGLSILLSNLRLLPAVVWAQVVIVHVPAALSLPLLLAARMLGKRIVVFQWDVYPVTLSGVGYATSPLHRVAHAAERLCLRLAHVISLPSEDFRAFTPARDPVILPLWPQGNLALEPVRAIPLDDRVIHIAFAGQINALRGLDDCIAHLRKRSSDRMVLHLFSADPFDDTPSGHGDLRIEHHGHLSRDQLQARLRQMHFGLISLSPRMDQPGFPSKTYEYLAAGIPMLHFGRPLPAFVDEMETCRIGVDITDMARVDLAQVYQQLLPTLEDGRETYLAHNRLTRERLASLL